MDIRQNLLSQASGLYLANGLWDPSTDPNQLDQLTPFLATRSAVVGVRFAMEYDDGYIAYINGVPVHSQHTPNSPGHDQPASSNHEADCPGTFDPIDMSESLDLLVPGLNLLALQVHNGSQSSSDFIFVPQLFGVK